MKNITFTSTRNQFILVLIALFSFASCSQKTAFVPQSQKLAFVQNMQPEVAEVEAIENVTLAENNVAPSVAPLFVQEKEVTKPSSKKWKRNAVAAVTKFKTTAPKAIQKAATEKLAGSTILASAAKGKTKAMLDGNLRLGIIFLIVGALVAYLLPTPLKWIGGILSIIGVIFLVLWLLNEL